MEIYQYPWDYVEVLNWRIYFDSIAEALVNLKVPDPPLYIQYNTKLFNAWHKWAITYEEPIEKIRPLGETTGPIWMQNTFSGLEDFYSYYLEIVRQEL